MVALMTTRMSLSRVVWSREGDRLYSFEQAALLTKTAVPPLKPRLNRSNWADAAPARLMASDSNSATPPGFGLELSGSLNGP